MTVEKQIRRAEQDFKREVSRQIDLVYNAAMIALHRYYHFGPKRILRTLEDTKSVFSSCGVRTGISVLEMLEDETGIELSNGSASWHDLETTNLKLAGPHATPAHIIALYQQEKEWTAVNLLASTMIALHRVEGFGAKRLITYKDHVTEIEESYNLDAAQLIRIAEEETSITINKRR